MKQILYKLPIILLFAACGVSDEQLCGKWQAVQFYEDQQAVQIPLEDVKLVFHQDHKYFFQTLGQYSEGGKWRRSGKYLILNDTTGNTTGEKILKIVFQSEDSLKIKMFREGKYQAIFFGRAH